MSRLPKTLTKSSYLSLRRSAQEVYGDISDKVAPGAALVEMVMEQVEEHALEAIPFTQVFCVEDEKTLRPGRSLTPQGSSGSAGGGAKSPCQQTRRPCGGSSVAGVSPSPMRSCATQVGHG